MAQLVNPAFYGSSNIEKKNVSRFYFDEDTKFQVV